MSKKAKTFHLECDLTLSEYVTLTGVLGSAVSRAEEYALQMRRAGEKPGWWAKTARKRTALRKKLKEAMNDVCD